MKLLKERFSKFKYIIVFAILIFSIIYFVSYSLIVPLFENHISDKFIYFVYEPVEWLRTSNDSFWKWTEAGYEQRGGDVHPKRRYFFSTLRRELVFYENGNQKEEKPYLDGKLNGMYYSWFKSGKKRSEIPYNDDEIHGSYVRWHKKGKLASQSKLINGEIDGKAVLFYPNGNIELQSRYKNGIPTDTWIRYFENGHKEYQVRYDSGKPLESMWWDREGKQIAKHYYKNGEPWNGTLLLEDFLITFDHGEYVKTINGKTGKAIEVDKVIRKLRKKFKMTNSLESIFLP